MRRAVSVGIRCRASSPAEIIEALVRCGLATIPAAKPLALFQEPGIHVAARQLGLPAVDLPREVLLARQAEVTVRSHAVEVRPGRPSVAEAAALTGAGRPSVLIVRRIAEGGATCGVAALREEHP